MLISRIVPTFDIGWFDSEFDFWRLRTGRDHISHYSEVGDLPSASGNVLAASFDTGALCWLMTPAGAFETGDMASLVHRLDDDSLTCARVRAGDVPQRNLLQLCINSIARGPYDPEPLGNIAGSLTVPVPSTYRERGGHLDRFAAVRVVVGRDMSLRLPVATFTSLDNFFPDERDGKKLRPAVSLPRYRFANGNRLVRDESIGDHDPAGFIERQKFARTRSTVAFLGLLASGAGDYRSDQFSHSKMGVLYNVVGRTLRRYDGHLAIRFADVPATVRLDPRRRTDGAWRADVAAVLGGAVRVVDFAGDGAAYSALDRHLRDAWGLEVRTGGDAPVLAIVRDGDWYEGNGVPDRYLVDFGGAPVQHIGTGSLASRRSLSSRVDLAVSDLAVKADIAAGRIRMVDWPALGLSGTWRFGYRIVGEWEGAAPVASVTIAPDGSLSFSLDTDAGFFGLSDDRMADIAREHPRSLVVMDDAGDANLIDRTDSFAMPEVGRIGRYFDGEAMPGEKVQATLPKGTRPIAGGVSSFDYRLRDMAGIEGAVLDSTHGIYKVAEGAKAIQTSVARAFVLRSVEAVDGHLLLDEVCRLSNVDFVRLHRPTVVPFPFKYLREWLRAEHPELA